MKHQFGCYQLFGSIMVWRYPDCVDKEINSIHQLLGTAESPSCLQGGVRNKIKASLTSLYDTAVMSFASVMFLAS